jgi:hypothetical protein
MNKCAEHFLPDGSHSHSVSGKEDKKREVILLPNDT